MRTTDVMGNSDTYPMASIASCPQAETAAAVTETITSDAPSDAPKPPPVTETNEDHEDDNHDHSVVDHDNMDTSAATTASFKLGGSSLMAILLMAAIHMV